ncbi:LLM class F420-dependent oxidoreductase [Nocardiopsis gilva YIM 90087]|uniref:LLM class F420-dependent oxidoreductase n=1 Tax=Nocardiopsis gilva YIM 90087 TaxID=1235441 RepID=A0A223S6V2_9ACTN|nr:LLM class F420-dependent oxidoreductase [Nocardiopsis gilva]ASU83833.1 LLM class F420-dependent oxidoreductase [Nocardiopsis gilva YIM 90087]
MKFGISTFVTDDGIRPDALGRALEERGFESLFLAEHSHIPSGTAWPDGTKLPRMYYRTLDPFIALTSAASATTNLVLGTGIALLIQRDVIHTAKEVASLDLLSGGRVILAVGVGWNKAEMRNHGTDPRTRGRLLDEQIAALKAIWTRDEAEFHGDHVDFGPIHMWPKPVQRPHPPIYIGGQSRAALTRVAAHGDGWFPVHTTPDEVVQVRESLAAQGRTDVTLNAPADERDLTTLGKFAEAGADRATFHLDTGPESATLRKLDELAAVIERFRN